MKRTPILKIIAFALCITILHGCEKNDSEVTQKPLLWKIEVLTVLMDSTYREDFLEFQYNDRRLDKIILRTFWGTSHYNFKYNETGQVNSIENTRYPDEGDIFTWNYTILYSNNKITRIEMSEIAPIILEYDNNGRLKKTYQEECEDYWDLYFYDSKGNINRIEVYDNNRLSEYRSSTYNFDVSPNPFDFGCCFLNHILDLNHLEGRIYRTTLFSNKNNITEVTNSTFGGHNITYSFNYSYNADNYPETVKIKHSELVETYGYTYF